MQLMHTDETNIPPLEVVARRQRSGSTGRCASAATATAWCTVAALDRHSVPEAPRWAGPYRRAPARVGAQWRGTRSDELEARSSTASALPGSVRVVDGDLIRKRTRVVYGEPAEDAATEAVVASVDDSPLGLDDEIGLQVSFFQRHGRYSDEPLSRSDLPPLELREARRLASFLVVEPTAAAAVALRSRLLDGGLIASAAA